MNFIQSNVFLEHQPRYAGKVNELYGAIMDKMYKCNIKDFIITSQQIAGIRALIPFLTVFKVYTNILSGKDYLTTSLVKGVMDKMKLYLSPNNTDFAIVKRIKISRLID